MITAFQDRLKRSIIVTARFTSTRSSLQVLMAIDILQRQDSTPRERQRERERKEVRTTDRRDFYARTYYNQDSSAKYSLTKYLGTV